MNHRILFSVVVLIGLAASSCDEPKVEPVSDEDQIARLIATDERAKDLFRTDSLIVKGEYRYRFDSGTFVDLLDSVTRTINITLTGTVEIQGLGKIREAIATIDDIFWPRIQRTHNSVTTIIVDTVGRPLTRFAYLLKLGGDNRPFLGWDLYGFSSLAVDAPVNVRVSVADEVVIRGDWAEYGSSAKGTVNLRYIKLSDIDTVKNGTLLSLSISKVSDAPFYHILSANTSQGHKTEGMTRVTAQSYTDSVIVATSNIRLFDLMMIQTFQEDSQVPVGQHVRTWCIPYRVAK